MIDICPFMTSGTCVDYHKLTGMKDRSCKFLNRENQCDLLIHASTLARLCDVDYITMVEATAAVIKEYTMKA